MGPKDIAQNQLVAVRRDTGAKIIINRSEGAKRIALLLDVIQNDMLKKYVFPFVQLDCFKYFIINKEYLFFRATADRDSHMILVSSWEQFITVLEGKNIILAPYCGNEPCEDAIKKDSAR